MIWSQFVRVAAALPQHRAVEDPTTQWTYEALEAAALRCAERLVEAGVAPGDVVAFLGGRSVHVAAAALGVWRAGAVWCPLEHTNPDASLQRVVTAAVPRVIIATQESHNRAFKLAQGVGADVLIIDATDDGFSPRATLPPIETLAADSLAYLIHTSGTTGQPKGVEVTHDALLAHLDWHRQFTDLGPGRRTLVATSLGFDPSIWELCSPLLSGATAAFASANVPRDPDAMCREISAFGVTTVLTVPSVLRALAETPAFVECTTLRDIGCGGEPLEWSVVRQVHQVLPTARVTNLYGPTEASIAATAFVANGGEAREGVVPIGRPIADIDAVVVDETLTPVPAGEPGELLLAGRGVARGYRRDAALTAERFVASPRLSRPRYYRTGDRVRVGADGALEFLGRLDDQLKVSGHRIETAELDAALRACSGVADAAVVLRRDHGATPSLVAYLAGTIGDPAAVARELELRLPAAVLPRTFVVVPAIPRLASGKVHREALPAPRAERPALDGPYVAPIGADEAAICAVFEQVLGVTPVGRHDAFFALGGTSLLALRAVAALRDGGRRITIGRLFAAPTPAALAAYRPTEATARDAAVAPADANAEPRGARSHAIAIIGMALRVPGASTVEAFWQQLLDGRDPITDFDRETLATTLGDPAIHDPDYVPARGVLPHADCFDAEFFGIPRREAELTDPQHRVLLELAWECIERAGYAVDQMPRRVGVFAGVHSPSYLTHVVLRRPDVVRAVGEVAVTIGNDKDYAATRLAHRLDLRGPALAVSTACSTSLTAVAIAVEQLRAGHCDAALAGAATIQVPIDAGYLYEPGAMRSRDGRTRPFDAAADGTSFNDGAAVVLLKRLDDALRDGDHIHAVIRGVGISNDGGHKASFTAPSVDGQAAAIAAALADAGVRADDISYVEAHGTATPVGDPIEIEALTQVFRTHTARTAFCALGSVKGSVGHLVTAAGAAGLIKTALALEAEELPATGHYRRPNPRIRFEETPFVPLAARTAWPRTARRRLAGVSSFGVGGTNVHVILEEAPTRPIPDSTLETTGVSLLTLSARRDDDLSRVAEQLAAHLERPDAPPLDAVAATLRHGRVVHPVRTVIAARSTAAAIDALRDPAHRWRAPVGKAAHRPAVAVVLPGQGSQYPGMGAALYASEPLFRATFDRCADAIAAAGLGDLRAEFAGDRRERRTDTAFVQAALFAVESSLLSLWRSRGLVPEVVIGHSVGEFVAAADAGVMALETAAVLVARRGAIMQQCAPGAMRAVRLGATALEARLPAGVSLAAENSPTSSVIAGAVDALDACCVGLDADGIPWRPLAVSHAFHSALMEPAVEAFHAVLREVPLAAPTATIVSTVTGEVLTAAEATSPQYWARHLRVPVRFSRAISASMTRGIRTFLELGPGSALSSLVRQHADRTTDALTAIPALSDAVDDEIQHDLLAAGRLWTVGVDLLPPTPKTRRVPLPGYPFRRERVWLEVPATEQAVALTEQAVALTERPGAAAAPSVDTEASASATLDHAPRIEQLVTAVAAILEEVSGIDIATLDADASLVELGFDSLSLTKAAQVLRKRLGGTLTYRQLLESSRSIRGLAGYFLSLDTSTGSPQGAAEAPAAPTDVRPTDVPPPTDVVARPATEPMRAPAPAAEAPAKPFGAIARIYREPPTLTERQRLRLEAFVRRYEARTPNSKAFAAANRDVLADPRMVSGFRPQTKEITYQIVIDQSRGSKVIDIDGNEYVDALGGFGMCLFGWQPSFVVDALHRQIDAGYEIGPMHPYAADVARLVCELTGHDRAALVNTGSEAVMGALRMARTVSGRNTIVSFAGSYHGTFDEVVVREGRRNRGLPAAPGIVPSMFEEILVLEYGAPASLDIIRERAHDIAAVLVEPIQSRRPEFRPTEFVRALRALTASSDICLIFDEVITGFRAGLGGAQAYYGVRADVATYGKVIGGGLPIGVIAGQRTYMDALDGGAWQYGDASVPEVGVTYLAGTFVRHPLALAAAKASLEYLRDHGAEISATLSARIGAMADAMNAHCRAVGAPVEIRTFASLWRVAFLEEHPWQDLLFAMMRSRGVHLLDNFPCYGTTALTDADLAVIVRAFTASIDEMQAAGFLPSRAAAAVTAQALTPPVPGARLGRNPQGQPAWYVEDPDNPQSYIEVPT
ncbi:MAG: amino acid adenylation domain-containing protein [Gemmatimonadaceae bacterium]|nr:amino acid adenylation domain-containing protein [Gemmatimonadaceae bacterium]